MRFRLARPRLSERPLQVLPKDLKFPLVEHARVGTTQQAIAWRNATHRRAVCVTSSVGLVFNRTYAVRVRLAS
jgi:hypothetical protein